MKKISSLIASLLVCVGFAGCGGGNSTNSSTQQHNQTPPTLTGISVTSAGSATTVIDGSTLQFAAKGTYSDNSSATLTSQVAWQSSDGTVATINASGLLTALKAGSVTVTATRGTISGNMAITVSAPVVAQPTLTSINVTAPSSSLTAGQSEQLTAQGAYSDSSSQTLTSQVTWQSSDSSIATVSSSGLLTGMKAGSVSITATMGTISGSTSIVVTPSSVVNTPTLSSITIFPSQFSIASGQAKQLLALGVSSDGTIQDVTAQVAWNSSASNIVDVTTGGLAMGVSTGSATIIATMGSTSGTTAATVTSAVLNSITVTPSSSSIATGQIQQFTANGIFSDGSSTDITNSVNWSSSATNIATIDSTGNATGVASGSTSIVATIGSVTGSASLTVTSAVLSSIDISPDDQSVPVGGQYQLMLTGTYSDNTTQTITNATWSSSDPTIASIDPKTGVVTGVANSNGNPVTITASAQGLTNTTTVFVTDAVAESILLTPATASIVRGTTQQYAVNAIFSDGTIQPLLEGLSWVSSSPTTAGVDASGLVTGLGPGQATITVTYGSLTGTAALTVTPAALTSMVVVPSSQVIGINGNVQFSAIGVFTDGSAQDLTSQATWSSSAASVAVISNTGLATALSKGTTTITASYNGVSGSTTLTVTAATLVSISITPANPIVPPHTKIQMTAMGTFSDGSTIQLSRVSWYTNTGRYATVSSSGVVRTKKSTKSGVPVYAKLNGVIGQTSLTITSMSVVWLQITPANTTIAVGTTEPFRLIGTFSDGVTTVDLTNSAQWHTSNYKDAVISRAGIMTGLSSGSVTITGSYGGLSPAITSLTITNAAIQTIAVTPSAPTIALGGLQQFTAMGTFSDGSMQDITAISQWTASDPSVAVVNQTGVATSASHGQTNINATFKGVSGAAALTVN